MLCPIFFFPFSNWILVFGKKIDWLSYCRQHTEYCVCVSAWVRALVSVSACDTNDEERWNNWQFNKLIHPFKSIILLLILHRSCRFHRNRNLGNLRFPTMLISKQVLLVKTRFRYFSVFSPKNRVPWCLQAVLWQKCCLLHHRRNSAEQSPDVELSSNIFYREPFREPSKCLKSKISKKKV